jgi:site-specific DNA-methyltransferase (adenine-specific)
MIELFENLNFEHQENENSLVILGDCIDVLGSMKKKSVDLIFADPPYNLGKDFGNDSDVWKDRTAYLDWCYRWIDLCFEVLKDDGAFYLMNSTQNIPFISVYLQKKYYIINDIVWAYDSSGVQSKKKYGSLYEPIIMASKSKDAKFTFNYEDIMVEAKTGAKRGLIDYRKNPPQPYNTKKVPGNVWEFPRVRYKMDEYENHPSQKPEALLDRIVLASSCPGEIVLDPFGGTFSTSAVAIKHGRKAISMDTNKEYYKIGLRRTGICDVYEGEALKQDKSRKTKNTSKKDHINNGNI